jgi:CubicO group peptidase (beta-lactamase class C family)
VATPLGLDFHIGLPVDEEARVAPLIDPPPPEPNALEAIEDDTMKERVVALAAAMADPESLPRRVLSLNGSLPTPSAENWNRRDIHEIEQPAANGITNARSLARMYAACVSNVEGFQLFAPETARSASEELSNGDDLVTGLPNRFGSGFMLPSATFWTGSSRSFGHSGAGGAIGFADMDRKIGFGYVQNQLLAVPGGDPRARGLIAALRRSLDD